MKVNFKVLCEGATPPAYATEFAAGADLYNLPGESATIAAGETVLIHTGIAMEIPAGYCGLIFARSGLATKRGLAPANKVGVIDADYRGEIMVSLHNHSNVDATFEGGERVAQICIVPFLKADFELTEDLTDTDRGAGGFGSTGSK